MKNLLLIVLASWCGALQANSCNKLFDEVRRSRKEASQPSKKTITENSPVHPLLISVFEKANALLVRDGMYKSPALRSALMAKPKGPGAQLLKIIETERFDVVIRRSEDARESVLSDGLTNVFETNLTMGATLADLPPSSRNLPGRADLPAHANSRTFWRSNVEATYLGMSVEAYGRIRAEDKPKYGYIRMSPQVKDSGDSHGTGNFGTDSWVLKKESIRQRTSFIMGDSQDKFHYGFPGSTKERLVNTEPSDWSSSLLGLEHLPLIIPEVLPELVKKESYLFRVAPYVRVSDVQAAWAEMGYSKLKRAYKRSALLHPEGNQENFWANSAPYIEAHIFGKLLPQNIEAFEFKKNPPSRGFCQRLRELKIVIRDGREWPPVEYTADLD